MCKYNSIESIIDKSKIKYNEPMKNHTTMRVGGNCDIMVLPESIEDIQNIISISKKENLEYYIIGNGSNVIVPDEGVRALVIKLASKFSNVEIIGNKIKVLSGCSMPKVSHIAKENSLKGFEFACGIPGTIGGGIRMNAGAYGSEIANVLEDVTYIDEDGCIKTINKDEVNFSYRHSIFAENKHLVIISATFKLEVGDKNEIENIMKINMQKRRQKQPLEYPNFGSVFKRPEGYFVGKLVDDAGLRGYTIGGAQVSEKHTGFIINKDNATYKDIVDLMHYIQKVVFEKFNVKLQAEVEVLGGKI